MLPLRLKHPIGVVLVVVVVLLVVVKCSHWLGPKDIANEHDCRDSSYSQPILNGKTAKEIVALYEADLMKAFLKHKHDKKHPAKMGEFLHIRMCSYGSTNRQGIQMGFFILRSPCKWSNPNCKRGQEHAFWSKFACEGIFFADGAFFNASTCKHELGPAKLDKKDTVVTLTPLA